MTSRLIMHVDMDSFFAAVEQRDDPSLRGKPVIVGALPGHRGVVATCSYEARKFGVRSAMPINEAFRSCPGGVYLRPDGARYHSASQAVMEVLQGISPVIEQVGVDEAYLDITGLERLLGPPEAIGRLVKERIHEKTDLTASVGIGPNRLIAKLASDHDKPDGLTIIPPDKVLDFLTPMPVSRLRGVGKKGEQQLLARGIRTIGMLRTWGEDQLVAAYGDAMGRMLYQQARGIASDHVGDQEGRKSISKEHTFNEDCTDTQTLRETLRGLSAEVARTARQEGLAGRGIRLKIRLAGFETHTRTVSLAIPTDLDGEIFREAWKLYETSPYVDKPVRLIGVGIFDWSAEVQLDLFARPDPRRERLAHTMDSITGRYGTAALGVRETKGK